MKKILLAFDGKQFSQGAFEFARRLNELEPVLLTGVFMPQTSYAGLWSYATGMAGPVYVPLVEPEESDIIDENIEQFEKLCSTHQIKYRVHKDYHDFALPELRRETRFADLLILSGEKFYKDVVGGNPFEFLAEALKIAECPVVVVPEKVEFPTTILFAYDGSASSMYAMKQFAYLLPQLAKLNMVVLHLGQDEDQTLPHRENLEELAQLQFPDVEFLHLNLDPKKEFSDWMNEKKSVMLIAGSYSRSEISQLFKKSFIRNILIDHKFPVFIAHK